MLAEMTIEEIMRAYPCPKIANAYPYWEGDYCVGGGTVSSPVRRDHARADAPTDYTDAARPRGDALCRSNHSRQ